MPSDLEVALLTAGRDRPYAFGLATALLAEGIRLDLIAGSDLDCPEFRGRANVNFLDFRGPRNEDDSPVAKASRVLMYYARLIRYAATAKPRVFHILWNNKFEIFDRTLLTAYYRILGKRIVLTLHNVNAGKRDSNDSLLNRTTLKIQYRLAHHIFVHTAKMKDELMHDFRIRESAITVIPFGINNAVPDTGLTTREARERLGLSPRQKVILFFGNIAPYKGLGYLVEAFERLAATSGDYQLVVAGPVKQGSDQYWRTLEEMINAGKSGSRILRRIEFVPDEETELYFKGSDVLILPYTHIFQSGVLFLAYSFGLPVIATDVGAMKEDIVEGTTGYVCAPQDPASLEAAIVKYFGSDLFTTLGTERPRIRAYAKQRYSWDVVAETTRKTYRQILGTL